jgi:hypothetical protein
VELAELANKLAGGDPIILKTLAAAYAEKGDYSNAVTTAQQALQIATVHNDMPSANAIQRQMNLYQNNQPYRETATASLYH